MRTFLFSDLRDYTVFIETRGDEAATKMLRASRRIVREAVATHRGAEVKTEGDSFYVVFRSPSAAVRCATQIQRAAARHTERHAELPVRMGVGINTGEAIPHDNGYVGAAVVVASRLSTAAKAGQILVTDTVRSLVRTGGHAPMNDLGTWTLKGITEAIHVFEVDPLPSSTARSLGPALPLPGLLISSMALAEAVATPELVGREAPMSALLEHMSAAAKGESRVIALSGEPGVGKSRLCRELATLAHREGHYVLAGRSHPAGVLPYEPFIAALRPYVRARGTDVLRRVLGPLVVEIRRLLPEIEIPITNGFGDAPESERRDRFMRAVQLLIEDAASQRPLLLVLEDLQDADSSSLEALRALASSLRAGVCIVFTYREEDLGSRHPLRALLAQLERDRRVARLRLLPLDLEGVHRMTSLILPERATDRLAHVVYERSEGIPFYVEELLKTASDDRSGSIDLALPRTVVDSVHLRVGRLVGDRGPASGDLLELLAVAGIPLDVDTLARAAGRPREDVAADLLAAVESQLLERSPGGVEVVQFRHRVTRDTVLSDIPPVRRRERHTALANVLESAATPNAAMLSRLFEAGGDLTKARRYAREGAASAVRLGAYATAIELLERAAALAVGASDELAILRELAGARCAAGNAVGAEAVLRKARALVADGDAASGAQVEIDLATALWMQGRRAEATAAAERAVRLIEPIGGELHGRATAELAELALAEGHALRAIELAGVALANARECGSAPLLAKATTVLGMAQSRQGRAEAIETLRQAIQIGTEASLPAETVNAWFELSRALLARGQIAEAGTAAEAGSTLAREHGLEFLQSRLLAHLTSILVNHGHYEEASRIGEQAVALAAPGTIASDAAKNSLAHVLTNQGEYEAALRLFDQISPRIDRYDSERRITFHAFRAQALVLAARLEEAAAAAEAAVSETIATPGLGMTGFLAAASVAESRRDVGSLRDLAHRFERYFMGRDTPLIRACRAEIGAILTSLEGGDGSKAFSDVAALYDQIGARVHALYRRGSAAIAQLSDPARRTDARAQVSEIRLELAERTAMRYVLLLDSAASRPTPKLRTSGVLEGRRLRVALMLAQGYTDRRIARELGVSAKEVARLVVDVLQKLGVRSRSQVASWVVARQPSVEASPSR